MAIEIVDLPMQNGDFPYLCKRLPEGIFCFLGPWILTLSGGARSTARWLDDAR